MTLKSKLWYLENFNLFKGLDKNSFEELNRISKLKQIKKGEAVYFATDPATTIYLLKQGRVKLTRYSGEGKELIIALINQGDVFGEMSVLNQDLRNDFATAMEDCCILEISKSDFENFLDRHNEVNIRMTKLIGLRFKRYTEKIEELVFKDAPQRVVSFLLKLGEDAGKKIGGEIFVRPFLTHEDIAKLTACSRQTVNAVLTDLREKKLINFDRKKLIIHNSEALAKFS